MLHADHSALQIIAHAMIAFLFLYRCFTAMPRFAEHSARLAERGMPFPDFALLGGFAMMLGGGAAVLLDVYSGVGAGALIVFTLSANYFYHNFWDMEGGERNRHLYTFCNNVAVMGGLVLVVAG